MRLWDDYYDPESMPWWDLRNYALYHIHELRPRRTRPSIWRAKVGQRLYSELWLKHYAQFRHINPCYVMAADYANHMTRQTIPLVRSGQLDYKLLAAHAELIRKVNGKPKRKGQNHEPHLAVRLVH